MVSTKLEIEDPILITGCARSGTSMTAGIINLCGAFGGIMSGPTVHNKKGMFENVYIRNNLVKPYLKWIGVDPMGQNPLPKIEQLKPFPSFRKTVLEAMKGQGHKNGSWFYKGAKMCLMWPIWLEAFPKAKWIIVRRADEDIIYSCMRTGFMRAYQNEEGWQSWIDEHKQRFQEMLLEEDLQAKEVWPSKFINGDFSEITEVIDWLGLEWNPKINEFIIPELWRTKDGKSNRP